ncbi:arsenic resistance protein [Caminicella sporogenes]|uniref:arsenic resistance protein n=1 Tax=Caminicella sporogenes TaxID=166485 RepID=UPI00253FE6A0|nr:bile acid:sodium symporter [Caminicella sporogenes]WIF95739.1 bile acid:sodium symporter [Caminicella sporogenes]
MVTKFLKFIKNNLPYLIIVSIVLGLIFGYFSKPTFLKSYVSIVLFLMVYPMMINLKFSDVLKSFNNIRPLIMSIVINFIISPILVFLLGKIFFVNEPMLLVGIILIGLIPTSGMTASWTGLAKGNLQLSLVMISVNLLLSVLMIPIYMKLFLGEVVTVKTMVILNSLLKVVIVPLILGVFTRSLIIKVFGIEKYNQMKPNFSGVSSLGVLIIVFIAMALKSKTIINQLDLVALSIVPLVIFYVLIVTISHFLGKKFLKDKDGISLVYATTMRNLTIALGLSLSSFGGSLAVFLIAIGYVVQLPVAAFYMKLVTQEV